MAKYGNENAAAGGTSGTTAGRDQSYGGGWGGIDRPDRGPYGGWTTPNYSWDQAKLSDFGILGAASNMLGGILAGNTYAGRSPSGFTTGQSRDLGALGPKAQGNTGGGKSWGGLLSMGATAFPGSSGRSAPGIGLQQWNRMLAAQQAALRAAQDAKVRDRQMTSAGTRPAEQILNKYTGVNANGLPEYGVWTPYHGLLG